MGFAPTPEHEELRAVVRSFLADKSSEAEVRRVMSTDEGYDPAVWKQMAQQLGLQGLVLSEAHGGAGSTMQEVGVVLQEMGRALLCAPFLSTVVLAATALAASGDTVAQQELLPQIAAGELVATVAHTEQDGLWGTSPATTAREQEGLWCLTGTKSFVLDGHSADVLVVSARDSDAVSLFLVDGDAAGVERTLLPTLDASRKQATVVLTDARAVRLGTPHDGERVLRHVLDVAAAALAMEQVGVAERSLELAVDHAKQRVQFGRPIGSFQAVKHTCADMLVKVQAATSAAAFACWAVDHEPEELAVAASLAQAYCSAAAFEVAEAAVHLHGGIGFTWEHPAHLYFKRAKSQQVLFGTASSHRARIAAHLGV
ncbi:MAG: acyl-CoA dehydrogenase family protein [Mycobacteriales bacterium]